MRTTVSISDPVLIRAKVAAHRRGITLGALVEQALQRELGTPPGSSSPRPSIPLFATGSGPAPGVDLSSNRLLQDVLDEDDPSTSR